MKKTIVILLVLVLIFSGCNLKTELQNVPQLTEAPVATETLLITATPDITQTPEITLAPEVTVTLTPSPAITPEVTVTPTPEATLTPEVTVTPTQKTTSTPEVTVTPTPTKKPTPTPTLKPTPKITPIPTPKPTPVPTPSPTATASGVVTNQMLKDIEAGFLKLVNNERARVGVSKLTTNSYLDNYAQTRSKEITTYFEHTRPNGTEFYSGIDENKYNYSTLGENICMTSHVGTGYVTPFTGSDEQIKDVYTHMYTLFKNSPGHYENMINGNFEHCGIGISYKTEKGIPMFYCAHIFGADF